MLTDQVYCILDYETYSEADLKKCGAYEYSMHSSTEILCAAWRTGTAKELRKAPTKVWSPLSSTPYDRGDLVLQLFNPAITLIAHNAYFEQCITINVLSRQRGLDVLKDIDPAIPERWICTASQAAAMALPRSLGAACQALNLPFQKDMEGHKLMLKMCKPRKATKKNFSTRHTGREDLERLIQYCVADIAAEVELFLATKPLTPKERRIWCLDQTINFRGFNVDRKLVDTTLKLILEETDAVNLRTQVLTRGELTSATQRDGVMNWLKGAKNIPLTDLRKGTVEGLLADKSITGGAREILEHRQAISKTSTAKYQAFEMRSRTDGRVRDHLMYHGASTGRWTGTGVQIQNLPRGNIKDTAQASEIVSSGDSDLIRMIYGNPMDTFSSCIRSVIIPSEGKVFDVADYNAIETRVLFWVAKHEAGLEALRQGRDLYREMAAAVFSKPVNEIAKDSFHRFIGKGLVLGAGYGMGGNKFAVTCEAQGQKVEEDFAKVAINTYRTVHSPVPKLWRLVEDASISAVKNPGKKYSLNYMSWYMEGKFLVCRLPSGRCLYYYGPMISYEAPPWGGEKRPILYHYGVESLSKKWMQQKTWGGTLVENVVQAIARDIMAEAMLRIEGTGDYEIVLSVHDELVAERTPFDTRGIDWFCALMAKPPEWGKDIPITVEGWTGKRYRK